MCIINIQQLNAVILFFQFEIMYHVEHLTDDSVHMFYQ